MWSSGPAAAASRRRCHCALEHHVGLSRGGGRQGVGGDHRLAPFLGSCNYRRCSSDSWGGRCQQRHQISISARGVDVPGCEGAASPTSHQRFVSSSRIHAQAEALLCVRTEQIPLRRFWVFFFVGTHARTHSACHIVFDALSAGESRRLLRGPPGSGEQSGLSHSLSTQEP